MSSSEYCTYCKHILCVTCNNCYNCSKGSCKCCQYCQGTLSCGCNENERFTLEYEGLSKEDFETTEDKELYDKYYSNGQCLYCRNTEICPCCEGTNIPKYYMPEGECVHCFGLDCVTLNPNDLPKHPLLPSYLYL